MNKKELLNKISTSNLLEDVEECDYILSHIDDIIEKDALQFWEMQQDLEELGREIASNADYMRYEDNEYYFHKVSESDYYFNIGEQALNQEFSDGTRFYYCDGGFLVFDKRYI